MALRARLLYDFEGDVSLDELRLSEGEVVTVIRQDIGDGWWEGQTSNGTRGLFPESYVEVIDDTRKASGSFSAPPRRVTQPQIEVDGAGDDDWDEEWRDESHEAPKRSSSMSSPQRDGADNALTPNGRERRSSGTFDRSRSGSTIRKNINRFSSFVKSGGESYILGSVSTQKVKIGDTDVVEIIDTDDGPQWAPNPKPFEFEVTDPQKQSKFKGIKSFIAYHITNSYNNRPVSRRYKHFDWLHDRLMEKFTLLSIPPLPDKQFAGRYGEEFVEKRREKLQMWLNRIARHPVVSQCEVFKHFMLCQDNEKDWKAGKRRAEKDDLVGAAFFVTVQHPQGLLLEESDDTVEHFGKFSRQMDEGLVTLRDRMTSHCEKCSGPFKREYERIGASISSLGECFGEDKNSYAKGLTQAVKYTGDTYEKIGQLYEDQPKYDLLPLIDGVKEYLGLLSTFPDLVQVHKGAVEKVKEGKKMQEEGKMTESDFAEVAVRTDCLSSVTLAEVHHFQRERVVDFKFLMTSFLREQIKFHQRIIDKLSDSLSMYEAA